MNGFICCTSLVSGKKVYIKADRIVLIERCEEPLRDSFTRIEYEGGNSAFTVKEETGTIFLMIEDALVENY